MPDMEKIIENLDRMLSNYDMLDDIVINKNNEMLMFHRAVAKSALAMLKEQEWHMLTEDDDGIIHGLPGDDGQYLMTDGKDIWIDDYVDGVEDGIFLDSGRDIREITAWMYMPELPKKDRR